MRARPLLLSALSAVSLLTLALTMSITPAMAQFGGGGQTSDRIIDSLEFQSADVRQALREVFKRAGVSYTIDPMVQGSITLSLKNVPFETALQNLTRQVNATYRVEGGVYQIVPQGSPDDSPPQAPGWAPARPGMGPAQGWPMPANDPPALTVDGNFVFVVQHGVLTKVDKKSMKVVGRVTLGLNDGGFGGGGFGR